ncbi:hypothetical protein J7L68_06280, partial [bacterium]|nr:hypothetical protein [bacterium]
NISTNQEEPQVPSSVPTSRDTFSQQVGEGTDAEHFLKVLLPLTGRSTRSGVFFVQLFSESR